MTQHLSVGCLPFGSMYCVHGRCMYICVALWIKWCISDIALCSDFRISQYGPAMSVLLRTIFFARHWLWNSCFVTRSTCNILSIWFVPQKACCGIHWDLQSTFHKFSQHKTMQYLVLLTLQAIAVQDEFPTCRCQFSWSQEPSFHQNSKVWQAG